MSTPNSTSRRTQNVPTILGGSALTGQVTFWAAPTVLTGDNALFWDNTNKQLILNHLVGGTADNARLILDGTTGNITASTSAVSIGQDSLFTLTGNPSYAFLNMGGGNLTISGSGIGTAILNGVRVGVNSTDAAGQWTYASASQGFLGGFFFEPVIVNDVGQSRSIKAINGVYIDPSPQANLSGSLTVTDSLNGLNFLPFYNLGGGAGPLTIANANAVLDQPAALSTGAVLTNRRGLWFRQPAGSITGTQQTVLAVDVEDQTGTVLTAALRSALAAGATKWFLKSDGTAVSFLQGGLRIGDATATQPTDKLEVLGNILITGNNVLKIKGTGAGFTSFADANHAANIAYTLPNAQAAASGYVLANDGAGGLSWTTQSGGPIGPPGEDGLEGDPGPPGAQGPAGATGATGGTGATGPQGLQGPPGIDGDDGEPGPPGPQGAAGTTGAAGATGAQGVPGIQGAPGDDGLDGEPGPPGVAGAVGPQGVSGPPGSDGLDGEDGAMGPPGPTGTAGAIGPIGPPGMDGEDGEPGMFGIPTPPRAVTLITLDTANAAGPDDAPDVSFTVTDAAVHADRIILAWTYDELDDVRIVTRAREGQFDLYMHADDFNTAGGLKGNYNVAYAIQF